MDGKTTITSADLKFVLLDSLRQLTELHTKGYTSIISEAPPRMFDDPNVNKCLATITKIRDDLIKCNEELKEAITQLYKK